MPPLAEIALIEPWNVCRLTLFEKFILIHRPRPPFPLTSLSVNSPGRVSRLDRCGPQSFEGALSSAFQSPLKPKFYQAVDPKITNVNLPPEGGHSNRTSFSLLCICREGFDLLHKEKPRSSRQFQLSNMRYTVDGAPLWEISLRTDCHSPLMKMVSEPVIRFIDFLFLIRVKRLSILERTLSKPIKRGKCLKKL